MSLSLFIMIKKQSLIKEKTCVMKWISLLYEINIDSKIVYICFNFYNLWNFNYLHIYMFKSDVFIFFMHVAEMIFILIVYVCWLYRTYILLADNIIIINQNFILFYQNIIAFLFYFRQMFAKASNLILRTFNCKLNFMCDVRNVLFDATSLFYKNNQFNFLLFYVDKD